MSVLLFSVLVAAACGGDSPTGTTAGSGGTPTGPTQPTPPVASNAVTVSDNQFTPSSIQVSPGTTVTWTWAPGSTTHNVSFTDGVSSGDRTSADASFTRTFSTAGTFSYVCTIHAGVGMRGTVLVQ